MPGLGLGHRWCDPTGVLPPASASWLDVVFWLMQAAARRAKRSKLSAGHRLERTAPSTGRRHAHVLQRGLPCRKWQRHTANEGGWQENAYHPAPAGLRSQVSFADRHSTVAAAPCTCRRTLGNAMQGGGAHSGQLCPLVRRRVPWVTLIVEPPPEPDLAACGRLSQTSTGADEEWLWAFGVHVSLKAGSLCCCYCPLLCLAATSDKPGSLWTTYLSAVHVGSCCADTSLEPALEEVTRLHHDRPVSQMWRLATSGSGINC